MLRRQLLALALLRRPDDPARPAAPERRAPGAAKRRAPLAGQEDSAPTALERGRPERQCDGHAVLPEQGQSAQVDGDCGDGCDFFRFLRFSDDDSPELAADPFKM